MRTSQQDRPPVRVEVFTLKIAPSVVSVYTLHKNLLISPQRWLHFCFTKLFSKMFFYCQFGTRYVNKNVVGQLGGTQLAVSGVNLKPCV